MRILWIDVGFNAACGNNSDNGIAWLRQRIENLPIGQRATELVEHAWHPADHSASFNQRQLLLERIDCGIERVVIASVNRLDYPVELIELLQHLCPEVPLALACGSWWDGWRRTGLKSRNHLSLPWYRWWDGWVDWLQGRTPQLYEPAPVDWGLLADAASVRLLAAHLPQVPGLIIGNCRQTLAAWSLAATAAGYSADCISEQAYQQLVQTSPTAESSSAVPRRICIGDEYCLDAKPTAERRATFSPPWVLWDDSCLDTTPMAVASRWSDRSLGDCNSSALGTAHTLHTAQPEARDVHEFFQHLPKFSAPALPSQSSAHVLGIVAVSLPRADWAQRLCSTSRGELLVKPNSGQGLTRLLDHYFSA